LRSEKDIGIHRRCYVWWVDSYEISGPIKWSLNWNELKLKLKLELNMQMSEYTKSNDRYIKSDVEIKPGKDYTWIIEAVKEELLTNHKGEEETKPVVYFRGKKKAFPLNKTNAKTIMAVLGSEDTDDYIGRKITLYAKWDEAFGNEGYFIRVRPPGYVAAEADEETGVSDEDDIEF